MISTIPLAQHRLVYPSTVAPTYHPFSLRYPAGWQPVEGTDFLAVLVDPVAIAGFQANLIVGASRVPAATPLAIAAQAAQEETAALFPAFVLEEQAPIVIGGQPAVLHLQSFLSDVLGERVAQIQFLFFAPLPFLGGNSEFFRIHATCHATAINTYMKPFLEVVRSFRFLSRATDLPVAAAERLE